MLSLDDAQWRAFQGAEQEARFFAGKKTGIKSIDAVTARIERLAREKLEREARGG